MRIVTDPIVDLIAFTLQHILLPPALQIVHKAANFVLHLVAGPQGAAKASDRLSSYVSTSFEEWVTELICVASQYVEALVAGNSAYETTVQWVLPSEASISQASTDPYGINKFLDSDSAIARYLEPYFAALGKEVRTFATRSKATWISLTLGHGTVDKIFAVVLGYAVVATMVALYLNILTVGNVKTAGRAVRSAVRQQLLVLKVCMFMKRSALLLTNRI